jgi:hypothetical protein
MTTSHELTFCSDAAGWINHELDARPELPFGRAQIEQSARGSRERVERLKIDYDVRCLGQADPQTGDRDPIEGIRRIEVKGRARGQPFRLTTKKWCQATQLGDSQWLYIVWDPQYNPGAEPLRIGNPAKHLDHAKKEIVAARHYGIPAEAVERAVVSRG